ncbi:hypothetical protein PYCCODRAFT_1446805 [Trametes coccinea BRFM310]|uniref:Mitochondrial intermembrane space import and assembly protein 40 n=1 Tax=Trametes coccinea (strain BRFM310) TaxID=1353009 RepID=A0A1Y2IFE2_TRAC3|nr:hypothetical protein PYCCODRAFT_1446805 [Trametes coccinea BRFM310]
MFRTFATSSLRRSLHTAARSAASARPVRLRAVLGASAVAASYLAWSTYNERIALDSPSSSSKHQVPLTPKSASSPEAISSSPSTAAEHEPSIPKPGTPAPADTPAPAPAGEAEEGEGSGGQGGAFNPETGEINWDCPCLGGMAHGPCGMEFREAFSCFVFSEAEPKGIDCVEKFKAMQECFRQHPDVYGDEIMRDDDDDEDFPSDAPLPSEGTAEIPTAAASPSPEADSRSTAQTSEPRSSPSSSA